MFQTDEELLRHYAHAGSQSAFAELVRRHVDLVYSAARRQVRSGALAEEVAQSVFLDLSRHAAHLKPATPLVAWLHLVTRRTAIDVIRRESRRQQREAAAAREPAESAAMKTSPSAWSELEPLLDEALSTLDEPDRSAILLRFFEDKSLREIGAALGLSEDTAQKRISRALDRLRRLLVLRGVAVTAAGLATDLSAHAIQLAPAALGPAISSGAVALGANVILSTTLEATKTVAMTTTQKFLVAAALTLAVGGALHEARLLSRRTAELQALQQSSERFQRELSAATAERDDRTRQLADALRQLNAERAKATATLLAASDPAMESALDSWLQNVARLKQSLEQMPDKKIPELRFLTTTDWLDATKELKFDSELSVREALSRLRYVAKQHFAPQLATALKRYLDANNNQPPSDGTQLAPYFESPVDPAILRRYGPPTASQLKGLPRSLGPNPPQWVLHEKAPVDDYYDSLLFFSRSGAGTRNESAYGEEVQSAMKAFQTANHGQHPTDPSQIIPYLHSPIDPAYIRQRLGGE